MSHVEFEESEHGAYIGQLSISSDSSIVWSAHIGGVLLSAWDAQSRCHLYDVNIEMHLQRIDKKVTDPNHLITAMTPALDTVWVGTASGHIMVFCKDQLLNWFQPHNGYIHFLTCIQSAGPCGMEKAILASGGKHFRPLVEGLEESNVEKCQSETIILWEVYDALTMQQVKLIEENSPGYLNNHNTVRQMISRGGFKDGTCIMPTSCTPAQTEQSVFDEALVRYIGGEIEENQSETFDDLSHAYSF